MLSVNKLPWTSILLLLLTYGVFGWLISALDISWWSWLLGAVYVVFITLALTAPLKVIKSFYTSWLKSDTRAFLSVIFGAFLAVIILCWLEVFIRILVLISASALARLDLQTAGYSKWQPFGILLCVSLTGFCIGLLTQQLLVDFSLPG